MKFGNDDSNDDIEDSITIISIDTVKELKKEKDIYEKTNNFSSISKENIVKMKY